MEKMREMSKHDVVLSALFYSLQDDLNDAWKMYDNFKKMKEHDEIEMARFTLADAKNRVDHAEIVRDKIDYYIKKNGIIDNSSYKIFYCNTLEMIEELKIRLSKVTI